MSTEEQDQIGDLVCRRNQTRRNLSALHTRLKETADVLADALAAVRKQEHVAAVATARKSVDILSDKATLHALLYEITEEERRLQDLDSELDRFHVPPPEPTNSPASRRGSS